MNTLKAVDKTIFMMEERVKSNFYAWPTGLGEGLSLSHIRKIAQEMRTDMFSYGKRCRWLGWIQCACCVAGVLTLTECKAINRECSEGQV